MFSWSFKKPLLKYLEISRTSATRFIKEDSRQWHNVCQCLRNCDCIFICNPGSEYDYDIVLSIDVSLFLSITISLIIYSFLSDIVSVFDHISFKNSQTSLMKITNKNIRLGFIIELLFPSCIDVLNLLNTYK